MTELKGAFETTHTNLDKILSWTAAPFDTEIYNQAWFNLADGELRTVMNQGKAMASYNTFMEPFVQDTELADYVDGEAGMEAVVKVPQFQQYLDFVGGKRVRVEFHGEKGERGAKKMVLEGDLRAELFIPSSESDLDEVFTQVVMKYDDENKWISGGVRDQDADEYVAGEDDLLDTSFMTTVEQFERIDTLVDFDHLNLDTYPLVVRDGEFRIDAADKNDRDTISGALQAEEVEGPDVENYYSRGFDELVDNVSGKIEVQTEQDSVAVIIRENDDGSMSLRYSILPVAAT